MIVADSVLRKTIEAALSRGADFAEVYVEDTQKRNYTIVDQRPDKAISGHTLGAGIRLFSGTEQVYTYTNDLSVEGLVRAALQAAQALASGKNHVPSSTQPMQSFGGAKKIAVSGGDRLWDSLRLMDDTARSYSSLIKQVEASASETYKFVQIMNSEGLHRQEGRSYLWAATQAFAEDGDQKEAGRERIGLLGTADDWNKVDFRDIAQTAAGQSLRLLKAKWAPAGEMPVLIDNAFGGVIFHEACGHGLETTSVAKNASVFCGKLGQKIANDCVTAIDDGTILGEYGSLEMDDEGEPTRRTTLIENGILKSYIVDKIGARRTGYAVTGSGRRQDYRFAPTSRMRNTFIAPGQSDFEDMVKDIDHGLYAKVMGGGSVSPGTGSYNFAVTEAFMVRQGRIEEQVKGASLIGTGIETLGRIVKVGKDLKLAAGTCGSESGMIPTTVGQPPILVSKLTVGGKA